jgi:DNA-binding response OmpR family regulator
MERSLTNAWDSGSSPFHARRRACLTRDGQPRDRLAVLVVDHDDVAQELAKSLSGQPVELRTCHDPAEALLVLGRTCPDVVLLGPATGRLDPIEFLTIARAGDPDVPVVVGAGPDSGDFAARATGSGATAVVQRPYRAKELLALLGALARQADALEFRPMVLELEGRLVIDGTEPRFWLDGKEVTLPPREFLLLRYLAERIGTVVTRKKIVRALWGEQPPSSNSLNVHVARLRKRLGDDEHNPRWIVAVRSLGLRFSVPPRSPDVHPGR